MLALCCLFFFWCTSQQQQIVQKFPTDLKKHFQPSHLQYARNFYGPERTNGSVELINFIFRYANSIILPKLLFWYMIFLMMTVLNFSFRCPSTLWVYFWVQPIHSSKKQPTGNSWVQEVGQWWEVVLFERGSASWYLSWCHSIWTRELLLEQGCCNMQSGYVIKVSMTVHCWFKIWSSTKVRFVKLFQLQSVFVNKKRAKRRTYFKNSHTCISAKNH